MIRILLFGLSFSIMLTACARRDMLTELALDSAGDNRAQLESLLARYDDTDRREMTRFLIRSMPGKLTRTGPGMDSIERLCRELPWRWTWQFSPEQLERGRRYAAMPLHTVRDTRTVTADQIATHIDDTYALWKSRPWLTDMPLGLVCELILPYRIADEPLSDWRTPYRQWLADLEDSIARCTGSVEAARLVAARIGMCPYNDQLSIPSRSALDQLEKPLGYCRDDCQRTLWAMRSTGIPAATDIMPVSPDNGRSHMWNVVYDTRDRRYRMFDNMWWLPTRDSIHDDRRSKGKVFRMTFAPDPERSRRVRNLRHPPAHLSDPCLTDVTAEYFGHNRARISTDSHRPDADLYLALWADGALRPVDLPARSDSRSAEFCDLEPGIVFFPTDDTGGAYVPCGYPFMIDADGTTREFRPDTTRRQRVRLTRKFPVGFLLSERIGAIRGLRISTAPSPAGPWTEIHMVDQTPQHSFYRIPLGRPVGARWMRLHTPDNTELRIAEVIASRDSLALDPIGLTVWGGPDREEYYAALHDGDLLSWSWLYRDAVDLIIRTDGGEEPGSLFVVPHNDDNYVLPGHEYELLWADGPAGWRSLGRRTAGDFFIEYDAPEGAVLLLRDLTRGREEQVFVWEDGRQMFSIDLRRRERTL